MFNIWQILLGLAKTFGPEFAKRAMTPPESWVRKVCDQTGADFETAMQERNESAEEAVEFLQALLDKDFTDPDDPQ